MNRAIQPTTLILVSTEPLAEYAARERLQDNRFIASIKARCVLECGDALRIEHSILEYDEVTENGAVDEKGIMQMQPEQPGHDSELVRNEYCQNPLHLKRFDLILFKSSLVTRRETGEGVPQKRCACHIVVLGTLLGLDRLCLSVCLYACLSV